MEEKFDWLRNTQSTVFGMSGTPTASYLFGWTAQVSTKIRLQMFYENTLFKIFKNQSANIFQNKEQRGDNSSQVQNSKTFHLNTLQPVLGFSVGWLVRFC